MRSIILMLMTLLFINPPCFGGSFGELLKLVQKVSRHQANSPDPVSPSLPPSAFPFKLGQMATTDGLKSKLGPYLAQKEGGQIDWPQVIRKLQDPLVLNRGECNSCLTDEARGILKGIIEDEWFYEQLGHGNPIDHLLQWKNFVMGPPAPQLLQNEDILTEAWISVLQSVIREPHLALALSKRAAPNMDLERAEILGLLFEKNLFALQDTLEAMKHFYSPERIAASQSIFPLEKLYESLITPSLHYLSVAPMEQVLPQFKPLIEILYQAQQVLPQEGAVLKIFQEKLASTILRAKESDLFEALILTLERTEDGAIQWLHQEIKHLLKAP